MEEINVKRNKHNYSHDPDWKVAIFFDHVYKEIIKCTTTPMMIPLLISKINWKKLSLFIFQFGLRIAITSPRNIHS